MSMTPRERWIATLNRETVDRIPTDYWSTPEVLNRLMRDLGVATEDDLWRELCIDRTHCVEPRYIGPELNGRDIWGIGYKSQSYAEGRGEYEEVAICPLAEIDDPIALEDYPWPSPDWYDYSSLSDDLRKNEEWPVQAGHFEPFLIYCSLRGLEKAFMDIVIEPDYIECVLQKIFDFHYEYNRRIFEAAPRGSVLFTYVAEDFGSQQSLLMGLEQIERFFIPRMKVMTELAHAYGIKAFHHDDGACRPVLPHMVEIGIDILNPIQWRCKGMEREGLKRDFGDVFVFHGGVDNQYTLPFGTPDDIRQEVIHNIEILGKGGGYIVAPCHAIQPTTPTENILALYETVLQYA